jgi:hypothetical protein
MRATSPVPHKRARIEIIPLIDSDDKIRNMINAQLESLFPA